MFDLKRFRDLFFHLYSIFQSKVAELNALDAAVGDGDHGATMARGFAAAAKEALKEQPSISTLFGNI